MGPDVALSDERHKDRNVEKERVETFALWGCWGAGLAPPRPKYGCVRMKCLEINQKTEQYVGEGSIAARHIAETTSGKHASYNVKVVNV